MSESALEIQKRLFGTLFAQSAETEPAPTTPESVQANVPQVKPTAELPTPELPTDAPVSSKIDLDYDLPPQELASLVESGACFYSNYKNGRPNHWVVKRCSVCHNFGKDECCGKTTVLVAAENDGELTRAGKQAVGLEPIEPPKTSEQKEQERITSWKDQPFWGYFRGADELSGSGKVEFLIDNFLMKGGVTFFGGPPESAKSLIGMSVAKALTTGNPLFGKLKVTEPCPVLWLAAEGGDNGLKIRLQNFHITSDKNRFICRTLSQGAMLRLDDPHIKELVQWMNPVVILETAVRFGEGNEDSASDSNLLAGAIFNLISYGARAVIAIHHSTKNVKKDVSLESGLRGSSDFGASADVVIIMLRDERLYNNGRGPCEVDLISCKGRDFTPPPIRLALTERAPEGTAIDDLWAPGLVSCLSQTGDLKWVDKADRIRAVQEAAEAADRITTETLEKMIQEDPTVTAETLAKAIGKCPTVTKAVLKQMGYTKPSGRAKKNQPHHWAKAV
jgi:AAA domain-containing protein